MGGLRYTDEETMGIVQQVLAGQVNNCLLYTSGSSGAAVQCMNLMLGLEETEGLAR